MAEPVELFRYIRYLRLRWRFVALSCGIAGTIAAIVTLLMPNQYTATARVLIEPPAGADLRSAMAVSPIYLESLKTYEQFASSDSLFQRAIDRFQLRDSQPIEALKKRVLKVGLVRNTRVLEISATMSDARAAQAMARFVAESTVNLARGMAAQGDADLLGGIEKQALAAKERALEADEAWGKIVADQPIEGMQAELTNITDLQSMLSKELSLAELGAATNDARSAAQANELRRQMAELEKRRSDLAGRLEARRARRDRFDAERKARQAELTAADTRLREARADSGYRGERMRIIDPGIVPQRPSSPNLLLNLMAALLLGLVLPVVYLAAEMNYQEQRIQEYRIR